MKKKTGVWIDSKQAVIITLTGDEKSVRHIQSNIESKTRIPGEGKEFSRFGNQYFAQEQMKEHKHDNHMARFLHEVAGGLRDVDSIVIFGPAETKISLRHSIEADHDLAGRLKDVITADKMTENQMVAWVRDYYD